jgi:hypothetical protein
MAKLKDSAITKDDIAKFADSSSDFGFELRILRNLTSLNIVCEHGGTYEDPVTKKPRQFDIRASLFLESQLVRFAIECKNIRENFPLVVFQVPRSNFESFHEIVYSHKPKSLGFGELPRHGSCVRLRNHDSFYRPGDYVGKSCSQVGCIANGDVTGNDAEVYDKWYQAIHSAHELVDRANDDWEKTNSRTCLTFVLPVLVVPNDRLWVLNYDADGERLEEATQVGRTTYYIDKFIPAGNRLTGISVHFSHLEIVTESGLEDLCQGFLNGSHVNKVFPQEAINAALSQQ